MLQVPQRHWRVAFIAALLIAAGWLGRQPTAHALTPLGQTVPPAEPASRYTGRLIVQMDPARVGNDTSAERVSRLQRALKSNIAAVTPMDAMPGWAIIELADPSLAAGRAAALAAAHALPGIRVYPEFVVPPIMLSQQFPNDPDFDNQWGLHSTGQTLTNGVTATDGVDINAPEGWFTNASAADVVLAIVDDGIDYTHEDLNDNLWTNSGEIPGNGIDDDNNGYVDDVMGWDFGDNDNDPFGDVDRTPDDGVDNFSGHGTSVAGIAGAEGNNSVGVTGVAWDVQLMPLKLYASNGGGFSNGRVINALNYAAANGATISNHSWGVTRAILESVGLSPADAQLFVDSICAAVDAVAADDHLVIAAAGNDSSVDNDTDAANAFYPASCPQANVVSVTGLRTNDTRFGNYGATTVDLAAPALSIYTTRPGDQYGFLGGTSAAAPFVSGAAALIRAQNPAMTYADIKAALLDVRPVAALSGEVATGGALYLADPGSLPVTLAYFNAQREGEFVQFTWQTATEIANAGFNLWAGSRAQRVQLNASLIPSQAIDSVEPLTYVQTLRTDQETFYLEEISLSGERSLFGPFSINRPFGVAFEQPDTDGHGQKLYLPYIIGR